MFVSDNSLVSAKNYFSQRLGNLYDERELNQIFRTLVMKRFGWNSADWLLKKDARLSESDLLYVRSAVKRLQENEPFQYVLGSVEFYGLELNIRPGALIPRPETEELVDWAVKSYRGGIVLDICSGSGCMALGFQYKFKEADVIGFEISDEALKISLENKEKTGFSTQFQKVDVLQNWPIEDCSVSLIMSNPPYISAEESETMKQNVLAYEPHLALFVYNDDVLLFYKEIAKQATQKLISGGQLFFEIHEEKGKEVIELLQKLNYTEIELRQDLQGKSRMIRAVNP